MNGFLGGDDAGLERRGSFWRLWLLVAIILSLFLILSLSKGAFAWTHGKPSAAGGWTHGNTVYFSGYGLGPGMQATFLAAPTAGIVTVNPNTSNDNTETAAVHAAGLKVERGIAPDGSSGQQGATWVAVTEGNMDRVGDNVSAGYLNYDWLWFNEPGALNDVSTPTAAADYTAVVNYWHAKGPGKKIGLSLNGIGDTAMGRDYLDAGIQLDFLQVEEYTNVSVAAQGANSNNFPFTATKAAYPSVQTGALLYGTFGPCSLTNSVGGGYDFIGFWDLDNYFAYVGAPVYFDASWYTNAIAMGGGDYSACPLPFEWYGTGARPSDVQTANFNVGVYDFTNFTGWGSPYGQHTNTLCEYEVVTGTHLEWGGPAAAGATVNVSWTPYTCSNNSSWSPQITLTVGSSGNCNVTGGYIHTGDYNYTCLLVYRAKNPGGSYGMTGFSGYPVNY